MSADMKKSLSMPTRWKSLACAVAALMTVGFGTGSAVLAQDASPVPAECDAPALPPGEPTSMEASPEAMPMEDMAATPDAATDATAEVDEGMPAEGETADAIMAAANNLAACVNGGNVEGALALMTSHFLESQFGSANPYDAIEPMTGVVFGGISFDNPRTYADGSVSIDSTYMQSQWQLVGETWYLVQDGDYWKVNELGHFTPDYEGDSAVVGVNLGQSTDDAGKTTYTIEPNAPSVEQPEVLVFHGVNTAEVPHEIVVIQLPEGADPAGLLDGSISESDVTFVGQITLGAGEQADMVLIAPPVGVYTLVCFFPDETGMPHAANGMVAQFEVTAAP